MATNVITNGVSNVTGGSYTPSQVASINAARDANVNAGRSAYSGNGATANSIVTGQTQNGTGTPLYAAPSTINSTNTAPSSQVVVPTPAPNSSAVGPASTAVTAQNNVYQTQNAAITTAANAENKATNSTAGTDFQSSLQALIDGIPQKGNVLGDPAVSAAHDQLMQAQAQTNMDTAQLNAITQKATTDKLSLVGQGNGVPQPIIGGQQAEIDREAAIQSLPIAAKIAIDQGNQTLAQQNLTYMTSVVQEKVDNTYTYQSALYTAISGFVDKAQTATLDALKTTHTENFTMLQSANSDAAKYAQAAIDNGQGTLAASLMKAQANLASLDPASPTFTTDLKSANANVASLSSGIVSLSAQLTKANIAQSYAAAAKDRAAGQTTNGAYTDVAQQALNQGATPQQAFNEALLAASNSGTTVTYAEQNALYANIAKMKATPVATAPVAGASIPSAQAPATPPSPIEADIASLKTTLPPKIAADPYQLQGALKARGYTQQQITDSSVGNGIEKAVSGTKKIVDSLFGSIKFK